MKLRKLLSTLLLFFIVLGAYILLATSIGLKAIVNVTQHFVPELQIVQVQGSVLGPMTLQQVHYHDDNVDVVVPTVNFDWQPLALLKGRLHVINLQVNDPIVQVNTEAKTKPSQTNHPTHLSWLERIWIEQLQINNGWIKPGDIHLQINGNLAQQLNLQWQIQADENGQVKPLNGNQLSQVEHILKTLRGRFNANGVINGDRLQPHIQANIQAHAFSFAQFKADQLQVNVDTNLTPDTRSFLQINGKNLSYEDYRFAALNLQAQGKLMPDLAVNWQVSAKLDPKSSYKGSLTAKGNVGGMLATPNFKAAIMANQIAMQDILLDRLQAKVQADFAKNSHSQLQILLTNLRVQGNVFTPIKLQADLDRQQQRLDVQLFGGQVHYPLSNEVRVLRWQDSRFQAFVEDKDLNIQGRLSLNQQQYINVNLQLPRYEPPAPLLEKQTLRGNVELVIQNIAPFLGAVTEVQNARGALRANMQISGTYGKPQLVGTMTLADGSADVSALNLQIRNIQLTAQGDAVGTVNWKGSARSGKGILNITGKTLLNQKDFATNIALAGENITASNTEHYKITISPDIQANYHDKQLTVKGAIKIPTANIDLGGADNNAVQLSNDVVFVHEKQKTPVNVLPITSQIQLQLGKDVHFQYQGLNTKLQGQLLLIDTPAQPTKGTGKINLIDGEYRYYGQVLMINKGSHVTFTGGDVENPTIAAQAVRVVTAAPTTAPTNATDIATQSTELSTSAAQLPGQTVKITVGVNVQGPVKNLQFTLFAQPPGLSQTDILSYLVTGSPSSQLGAGGASMLFNAVSSLNSGGGGTSQLKQITKQVQQTLGLSELGVQSSPVATPGQTDQGTALVLGKALSPRVYINYSVGLMNSLSAFQARYLVSKYWTLQSTTTTLGSGIDMLYTIERGK